MAGLEQVDSCGHSFWQLMIRTLHSLCIQEIILHAKELTTHLYSWLCTMNSCIYFSNSK
jgi:hypothetical protein